MTTAVSVHIIQLLCVKRPTTARPPSVSVATTLDCCCGRSVSCWILVRRANYTILPTIWQIISRWRWIRYGSQRPALRRLSSTNATLHSVAVEEAAGLLIRSPAKHCPLDPVPTWLLKRAAEQFAPILARLCNVSFQAGNLPLSQKHALVSARLKKSTLDPADLNSYRSMSQLPFASKLVERAVAMSMDCCLPGLPSLSFDWNGCRHRLQ